VQKVSSQPFGGGFAVVVVVGCGVVVVVVVVCVVGVSELVIILVVPGCCVGTSVVDVSSVVDMSVVMSVVKSVVERGGVGTIGLKHRITPSTYFFSKPRLHLRRQSVDPMYVLCNARPHLHLLHLHKSFSQR